MKLITAALIAAKAQFNPIYKNKVNPHFKSKIDRRIGSMTPAEFEQLLTLMRQTANLEANNNISTSNI
jgi:hypothetical protein